MASKVISTILNLKDNFSNVIKQTTSNTKNFTSGVRESGQEVSKIGISIKDTFKDIGESIKNGIGFSIGRDIWGSMKEGISETVNLGNELQKSLNKVKASTRMTNNELSGMRDIMLDIYNDNFGEDFEDIGEAIKIISQQTGAGREDLKSLTKNALALRDTFGYEIGESIRSANTLMTQFGISGDEAFNLIAQGQQQGLDFSGEMLDSINEYSVQFKKLGLNAEDMFNILNGGAIDGAFNLDKVGDAVKEFSIRAIDGSKTTTEGFTLLGLNANEMSKKFAKGGEDAKKAFKQVTKAIGDVNDPVKQSIIGVNLFGTMWEDLGPKVVTQLGNIGDEFNTTIDTMDQIKDVNFDNIGSALQYIKRNLQTSIILPISNQVLPRLNNFAKWFKTNIPTIKEKISSVTDKFLNIGSSIIDKVFPSVIEFGNSVKNLAKTIYDNVVPAVDSIKPDNWDSVSDAIKGIVDKATDVVNYINDNWPTIEPIVAGIIGALVSWKLALMAVNTWATIVTVTTSAWETIEMIIWGIKNATTAWEAAQWALNVALDANPIGVVTLAIVALGFAIYQIIKHWEDIWGWIKKVWDIIDSNPILKFISFAINPLGSALMELIKHWDNVVGAIKKAWDWLTGWIDKWNNTDLKDKNVNINTHENTTYTDSNFIGPLPQNATGTHYWRGGATRMNEYGNGEMAVLPSGSKIIPAGQTDKILNNSNKTQPIQVIIQGNVIGNESFIDQLGSAIYNKVSLALINS